ncbi:MAG: hypothetical protein ACRDGA_05450, partial [Bacteroidota bacterium]
MKTNKVAVMPNGVRHPKVVREFYSRTTFTQERSSFVTGVLALLVVALLFYCQRSLASDPIPAPKQKKPIALVGGTIHTVSGVVIPNGTIVFDKGKIVAVGANVAIPTDAERIDVAGKHVYPGLIDANSNMGLTEIGSVRGTLDIQETGSVNPSARAEVAVHPESELLAVARSAGITVTAT